MYSIIFICVLFLILYAFRNCLMETGKLLEKTLYIYVRSRLQTGGLCHWQSRRTADPSVAKLCELEIPEVSLCPQSTCGFTRSPFKEVCYSNLPIVTDGFEYHKLRFFFNSVTFENLSFLRHICEEC